MLLKLGNRYLFMTQRYAWHGTVVHQDPTHVELGEDAEVEYEDIGPFEEWASGKRQGNGKKVPGLQICMLGTDAVPLPPAKKR